MAPVRPFPVSAVLTAIAVGYRNPVQSYIADEVLPRQQVGGEIFKWTEYPISEAFNTPDGRVGRKGRVPQLEFTGTEKESAVEDYGFDVPIPNSDIEAAANARARGLGAIDPEAHAVEMVADTLLNIREARVASLVHNLNTYAADKRVTLSGTSQFSDYANSDPITVIKTGMDATLIHRPNTMVMGRAVWSKLSSHPKLVNAVKGGTTTSGLISVEQFLELFAGEGIRRLLIGDTWANTAKPGQQPVLTRTWGKHIAMIHQNPAASIERGGITFGMTADYGGRISGSIDDPDIGLSGGRRTRTGERVKELIIAKDVGYFIQNAVA